MPLPLFKHTTGAIMREIRQSRKAPGHDRIYLAGEKEFDMVKRRKAEGIPIDEPLQKIMKDLIAELKLGNYDFPFVT